MKRVLLVFGPLLASLLSLNSCKKNVDVSTIKYKEEGFSIEEGKEWFKKRELKSQNSSVRKFSDFTVLWNTAKATEDDKYSIIQCDLSFNKSPGFFISDSAAKATIVQSQINGDIRLVLLKNKSDNRIHGYLMNTYSRNERNRGKNGYMQVSKDFDGFVFFTDLDGYFVNGWEYQNGGIIRSTKIAKSEVPEHDTKGAFIAPVLDCGWIEVQTYQRTCLYDNGVIVDCTQWEYIGSEYYYFCPNTGGGGGGGVYEEAALTPPELSVSDNIVNIGTVYDPDGNRRTRSYKWVFLRNAHLTFTSYDRSIQKKGSDGLWRFESLTHDSDAMTGTQAGWEVSYSLKGITPAISQFWASLHFDCLVTSKTNFQGRVYANSKSYPCEHYFHINDGN